MGSSIGDSAGGLSGHLEHDAPALSTALKRLIPNTLSEHDYQVLHKLYRSVHEHGGTQEEGFVREEGVSFNPRPARICRILLKNCELTTLAPLAAGMLITLPKPQEIALPKSMKAEINDLFPLAERASRRLQGEPTTYEAELVALAALLDRIRHLHMSDLETQKRIEVLANARGLIETGLSLDPNHEIIVLLQSSIERLERQMDIS